MIAREVERLSEGRVEVRAVQKKIEDCLELQLKADIIVCSLALHHVAGIHAANVNKVHCW